MSFFLSQSFEQVNTDVGKIAMKRQRKTLK